MSARREGWASPETPRERQPTADDLPLRGWAETAVFIRLSWWDVGAGGGLKRPHNPKVVGSNPTPQPKSPQDFTVLRASLSLGCGVSGRLSPGTPRKALALEPGRVKCRQAP